MIIALIIAVLFGVGSMEVFYIDKIEKGVKKGKYKCLTKMAQLPGLICL